MALMRVFYIYSNKKFILLNDIKFMTKNQQYIDIIDTWLMFCEITGTLCDPKSVESVYFCVFPRLLIKGGVQNTSNQSRWVLH